MNIRMVIGNKRRFLVLSLAVAIVLAFISTGPGGLLARVLVRVISLLIPVAIIYLLVQFAMGPLSRLAARIGFSIRWKVLAVISFIAALFMFVSLANFGAMDYMHEEMHRIRELRGTNPEFAKAAFDALENFHHGPLITLSPVIALLGALVALGLGMAMAWSVIGPVRRMGQAMHRIAAGDFSQPVRVENRDELGDLANRINQTAQELARLQEATLAEERAKALQERIAHVTLAQEEERRRISRELHDGLGPDLAALANRIRACQYMVRSDPQRAEDELQEIAKNLKGQIQNIRELIYDLRPLALDQLGLVEALRQQLERLSQDTGVRVAFNSSGEIVLDPLSEVIVFRVTQECLTNVQKHASASFVELTLHSSDSGLRLIVKDNGKGFDPKAVATDTTGRGLGLLSMKERAELLGGKLIVESSLGGGCEVSLQLPSGRSVVGVH